MARRVAVSVVLALALVTVWAPTPAPAVVPATVTLSGPSAVGVGDLALFTGNATLIVLPMQLTTVNLEVNGFLVASGTTDAAGDYTIPYAFGAPGVYSVVAVAAPGTLVEGSSPALMVSVGSFLLTVSKSGTGDGAVSSSPAGIDCGGDCTEIYSYGTSVDLSATPAPGNTFSGWSGACTGTGACTVSMTAARSVTAAFTDTAPPSTPVLTGSTPPPPANNNSPSINGTAQAGSTVRLYTNASCSSAVAGMGTATGGSFSIPVAVGDNTSTTYYATASDAAGTSGCSAGLTYVEDSIAPAAPALTGFVPASPANNNNPSVIGTAEAGSTVRLFTSAACIGAVAGTGPAPGGSFSIPVSVGDNTSTTFYGTATDAAGNTSGCSGGITYVEDSAGPAAPVLTSITPAGPANFNFPTVNGTAEPGSTVRVFANNPCTGAIAAIGTASGTGAFSITATVPDNSTTTFRATAQDASLNTSGCSNSLIYVEDSFAATPVITGSTPSPPANNNTPSINGSSEAGSLVLYTNATCTSAVAGSGPGGAFSIMVAVADNTSTTFYAQVTDLAGNVSACSAGFTYVEDSIAPAPPTLTMTTPASPANDNQPRIHGIADPGVDVILFTTATCTGNAAGADRANPATGGAFSIQVLVPDDSTTTFYAKAIDSAGNNSLCSAGITYVEDSTAPSAPLLTGSTPGSPANANAPSINGAAEAGSTVKLYTNATCTSAIAGTGPGGAFSIVVTVPDNSSTTFRATATDAAGNTSACSSGFTYVEDSTALTPSITGSTPGSPANNNFPSINGTAEAGSTVKIFTSATCAGGFASGPAPTGTFSIPVGFVPDDSTTPFSAMATDGVGNVSACSLPFSYVEDSMAPAPPALTMTTPASPANNNNPRIHGTAEPGVDVFLFTTATCTGDVAGADSANPATGGAFSILVGVPDDTSTTFYAKAVDDAGNSSACSAGILYVEDSTAPAAPVITGSTPASPADDTTPTIDGTAEVASTVTLYTTATCTGTIAGTGPAPGGVFGIAVTVADGSSTTFRATATDAAGNVSVCSAGFTYMELP